jgi:hypothetical protein
LVTPLLSFRRYAATRAGQMRQVLLQLHAQTLSPDLTEKLNKALYG